MIFFIINNIRHKYLILIELLNHMLSNPLFGIINPTEFQNQFSGY